MFLQNIEEIISENNFKIILKFSLLMTLKLIFLSERFTAETAAELMNLVVKYLNVFLEV